MSKKGEKATRPVDIHVGSRVRARRLLLGMSQEALGVTLGLTFQQVQKYERGSNRIGASRLWDIAEALEVPVSYFFEGLDTDAAPPDTDPIAEFINSPEGVPVAISFNRVRNPSVRRAMLGLLRSLSDESDEENLEPVSQPGAGEPAEA